MSDDENAVHQYIVAEEALRRKGGCERCGRIDIGTPVVLCAECSRNGAQEGIEEVAQLRYETFHPDACVAWVDLLESVRRLYRSEVQDFIHEVPEALCIEDVETRLEREHEED